MIEGREVERFDCFRFPQSQEIAGGYLIPADRRVVGDAFYFRFRNPTHAITTVFVRSRFGVATELDGIRNLWPHNFPGVARPQPFLGNFLLPATADHLVANSELVANAVADRRHFN